MGPVKGPRNRGSRVLPVAAGIALAIVLVVAFATSRWRTSAPPVVASAPIATAANVVVPASIDAAPEPESRVTVRPAPAPPVAAVPPAVPPRPATIPGKIQLVGEVRDPSGQRILAMPAVLCYRTPTRSLTNSVVRGEFVVGGLDPGTMLGLECAVKGYRPETRRIQLKQGDGEQREDFVLQPLWMIDVVVRTSDGKNLARKPIDGVSGDGLRFRISEDPPPENWDESSAEARRASRRVHREPTGPFGPDVYARIAPLCDPPQFLSVDAAGHVLAATRLDAGVGRATLVIPVEALDALKSSFTCTVVGREDGAPLAKVHAFLTRKRFGSAIGGTSDATGRIRCDGLLSGSWVMILNAKDRSGVVRFFDLRPGAETDLGAIALDLPIHVRGRFVDEAGRPIQGRNVGELAHEVIVLPYSAEDPAGSNDGSGPTRLEGSSDGTFEGNQFGRERYVLKSASRPVPLSGAQRIIRTTVVDCRQGSVDDLVLTAEPAYQVTVRAEVDEAKDFGYSIFDADGVRVLAGDLAGASTGFLASGDYRLLVGPDAAHLREIPFTVGTGPLMVPVEP